MALIFGLTGGIASGKSTVSAIFAREGVAVVDADSVSRDVVEPGTEGHAKLVEEFGPDVVTPDGRIGRDRLGALVFRDKEKMGRLTGIVLPLIIARSEELIRAAALTRSFVCFDAATLVETGAHANYKPLVVVYAKKSVQLQRLMERNSLSKEEAERRISSQLPTEEKIAVADHVIENSGTLEELELKALAVLHRIVDSTLR